MAMVSPNAAFCAPHLDDDDDYDDDEYKKKRVESFLRRSDLPEARTLVGEWCRCWLGEYHWWIGSWTGEIKLDSSLKIA
jgi:hypothetical protein